MSPLTVDATVSTHRQTLPSPAKLPAGQVLRWSWACRHLDTSARYGLDAKVGPPPRPGDLVAVRVEAIGEHQRLVTSDNKRLRIYPGDLLIGVFGNRYATDAFEAVVDGVENLSLLTGGGMVSTVKSRHHRAKKPTRVTFAGHVFDETGSRINLKDRFFRPQQPSGALAPLIAIVGSGMNSGKTTSSVSLIKGLASRGLRVAACKLTGSVSNRDQDEMRAAAAAIVVDFSDYGFPSTYMCSRQELLALWQTMLADAQAIHPDMVVMELADGVLQRETAMLLREASFREGLFGIVVTADNALSALYALGELDALGHRVLAVSGVLTSSPLYVNEFRARSSVPVGSSVNGADELVELVLPSRGEAA